MLGTRVGKLLFADFDDPVIMALFMRRRFGDEQDMEPIVNAA